MDQTIHLPSSRSLLQCYIGGRPCNKPQHVKFEPDEIINLPTFRALRTLYVVIPSGRVQHAIFKSRKESLLASVQSPILKSMIESKSPRRTPKCYKLLVRSIYDGCSVRTEISLFTRKFSLKMARRARNFLRQQGHQHIRYKVTRSRVDRENLDLVD